MGYAIVVSSKNDLFNSFERKILYIGQETNSWLNYDGENKSFCVDDVEQAYLNFLSMGANNKEFWTFIRNNIKALPLKEDLSKEEFDKLRTNFNVPSLGKLSCTYDRFIGIKKRLKYLNKLKDDYNNQEGEAHVQ